jgi:hypothetical protein
MAISYVGGVNTSTSGDSAGSSSLSLTALSGGSSSSASAGDIVFVLISQNGSLGSISVPTSGYTLIDTLTSSPSNYSRSKLYWKYLSTAETSVSFDWQDNSGSVGAVAYVWSGASPSPFDATTTTATGSTSVVNPASITPVSTGAYVLIFGANAYSSSATNQITAVSSGYSNSVILDTNSIGGARMSMGVGSKSWTSGAEDPGVYTTNGSAAGNAWTAFTVAIKTGQAFTISESVSLTETITNLRARNFSVSETTTLTESITSALGKIVTIVESISLTETLTTTRTFLVNIAEGVGLTEVLAQVKKKWNDTIKSSTSWTNSDKSSAPTWTENSKSSTTWTETDKS